MSDLKEKNNSMKKYICQIVYLTECQEINDKIETYNENLIKWGDANGIVIMKTTPNFILNTGKLNDLCFVVDGNYSSLNRLSVVRLLESVAAQCPEFILSKGWKNIKKIPL